MAGWIITFVAILISAYVATLVGVLQTL